MFKCARKTKSHYKQVSSIYSLALCQIKASIRSYPEPVTVVDVMIAMFLLCGFVSCHTHHLHHALMSVFFHHLYLTLCSNDSLELDKWKY